MLLIKTKMTRLLLIWTVLLGLTTLTAFGQTDRKIYTLYVFGAWFYPGDSCAIAINKKYGFKTIDGGCFETKRQTKHNRKVEELLLQHNGSNWRERYSDEIKKCNPK